MDAVLEHSVHLGCIVRDSPEGRAWREARRQLEKMPIRARGIENLPVDHRSIVDNVLFIHKANRARPLLFPLLVGKFLPHLAHKEIRRQLRSSEIWQPYRELELCAAFVAIAIEYLRSIAPGYPHKGLVYTLPNTPWAAVSSFKELPWNSASSLIPAEARDAHRIGLERVVSTTAPVIAHRLNLLVEAITNSEVWTNLAGARKAIERKRTLQSELQRSREQFAAEFETFERHDISIASRNAKAEEIAEKVYAKRGSRIQRYVEAFLHYEQLLENIYWLLSQLIAFEDISCLTSDDSRQVQQVFLSYGKRGYVTALATTRGKTLAVGQLAHLTLTEIDSAGDGLYQIELLDQRYDPSSRVRVLFRGRCLWSCSLSELREITERYTKSTLVENETPDLVSTTELRMMDGEKVVESLSLGELMAYKVRDTMYLP